MYSEDVAVIFTVPIVYHSPCEENMSAMSTNCEFAALVRHSAGGNAGGIAACMGAESVPLGSRPDTKGLYPRAMKILLCAVKKRQGDLWAASIDHFQKYYSISGGRKPKKAL